MTLKGVVGDSGGDQEASSPPPATQ